MCGEVNIHFGKHYEKLWTGECSSVGIFANCGIKIVSSCRDYAKDDFDYLFYFATFFRLFLFAKRSQVFRIIVYRTPNVACIRLINKKPTYIPFNNQQVSRQLQQHHHHHSENINNATVDAAPPLHICIIYMRIEFRLHNDLFTFTQLDMSKAMRCSTFAIKSPTKAHT